MHVGECPFCWNSKLSTNSKGSNDQTVYRAENKDVQAPKSHIILCQMKWYIGFEEALDRVTCALMECVICRSI